MFAYLYLSLPPFTSIACLSCHAPNKTKQFGLQSCVFLPPHSLSSLYMLPSLYAKTAPSTTKIQSSSLSPYPPRPLLKCQYPSFHVLSRSPQILITLSRLIKGVPFFCLFFSFLTSCSSFFFLILISTAIERNQRQLGVCFFDTYPFYFFLFFFLSSFYPTLL